MKILIIGGGNMGSTFARSFLKTHIVSPESLFILDKRPGKINPDLGTIHDKAGDYIREMDLIIIAVKPQDSESVMKDIYPYIDEQQVILSIMAGIKMDYLMRQLPTNKIIRAMPNLPAQIGFGMTAFTSTDEVTRIELVTVQNLLNSTGKTIYQEDEDKIDAATAISGSGPAYVFYFMKGLIEAAKDMGFNKSEAELLSYQTFHGAVELFNNYNYTCDEWIAMVSSKGGTTEAAFKRLKEYDMENNFKDAVDQALNRAKELGEQY